MRIGLCGGDACDMFYGTMNSCATGGAFFMSFPQRRYKVIYADPAWSFKAGGKKGAKQHYQVMNLQDIKALPVSDIADDDCVLFMWATAPMLPQALEVISAWGFKYKTVGFTWVKRNKIKDSWFWGLGYWTRANAELCLLATKGKPQRICNSVHQIVDTKIERHSKKPHEVRKRIKQLMGDVTCIELFARERFDGWDAWGNEL